MNFLAHLLLAGDDEGLRLGAMLGDFVRGREALNRYDEATRLGIRLPQYSYVFWGQAGTLDYLFARSHGWGCGLQITTRSSPISISASPQRPTESR